MPPKPYSLILALMGFASIAAAQPNMAQHPVQLPASSAKASNIPPADAPPIKGTVSQAMKSGGYTYVNIKDDTGQDTWIAMPETDLPPIGSTVAFRAGMEMNNFESKSLKRKFEKIIFSEGPVAGTEPKAKENRKSPGSKGAVAKAEGKIRVEKAAGANGYTIAEIYRQKAKLDKKKISVRGKVVKVSGGIMSRNWIHLQDGSGSTAKGTNNLVVTSKALPLVGDVVTATGILYKDRDFGGGYRYEVIMEKAELLQAN